MYISVAWFHHARDTTPKTTTSSWSEYVNGLQYLSTIKREPENKLRSPLVSPAIYPIGASRRSANVKGFGGWFAIDIDGGSCSIEEASSYCCKSNVSHVIWTTTSHSGSVPCFRLAFPLDRYVCAEEVGHFWYGVHAFFQGWGDVKTKDPARMMIAPANWSGTNSQFLRVDSLGVMPVSDVLNYPQKPVSFTRSSSKSPQPCFRKASKPDDQAQSRDRARAVTALAKMEQGTLTHEDLRGVKAVHLLPISTSCRNQRRQAHRLAAAKRVLKRLRLAAK